MHERNVIHRDIKSMNMFLTRKGEGIKIGDLGVAKVLSSATPMANTVVGTPYYLSPELCEEKPYDQKSDVWALGCVLYEMCCFRRPFKGNTQPAVMLKILRGNYAPLPTRYSRDIRIICQQLLQRSTNLRPTCADILYKSEVQKAAMKYKLTKVLKDVGFQGFSQKLKSPESSAYSSKGFINTELGSIPGEDRFAPVAEEVALTSFEASTNRISGDTPPSIPLMEPSVEIFGETPSQNVDLTVPSGELSKSETGTEPVSPKSNTGKSSPRVADRKSYSDRKSLRRAKSGASSSTSTPRGVASRSPRNRHYTGAGHSLASSSDQLPSLERFVAEDAPSQPSESRPGVRSPIHNMPYIPPGAPEDVERAFRNNAANTPPLIVAGKMQYSPYNFSKFPQPRVPTKRDTGTQVDVNFVPTASAPKFTSDEFEESMINACTDFVHVSRPPQQNQSPAQPPPGYRSPPKMPSDRQLEAFASNNSMPQFARPAVTHPQNVPIEFQTTAGCMPLVSAQPSLISTLQFS